MINPIVVPRNISVDQIVTQVANQLQFPINISELAQSSRNDSNNFPQILNSQDHSATRVAWNRVFDQNLINQSLKITIARSTFPISRSSTKRSVRHDPTQSLAGGIAHCLIDQRNFNMAQFCNQFKIFGQSPAINRGISASKTLDRIWRGVQANMADLRWNFDWLFQNGDRDVGCVVTICWIPIRMNNELGNICIFRLIVSIVIVLEIKVGFRCLFGRFFFLVLQAVGRE